MVGDGDRVRGCLRRVLGLRERKGSGCSEWRRRRGVGVESSGGGERKRAVALMAVGVVRFCRFGGLSGFG